MSFDSVMGKTIYPVKSIAVGCDFISGYAFKGKDFTDADGHPIIKIKNIQDGKVTIKESQFIPKHLTGKKLEKFKLENGDILIAMTGQGSVGRVGKLYISTTETPYLNQRVGKFLVDEENLNKEYLYYVLSCKAYENYLFAAGSGSGQPNLSPALIKAVEIPYPPYKSQCYIGKILSDLDEKIHLNNQINQTLESIAQTIFKSWFIDFDPVRAKIAAKQEGKDAELAAMCAISGKSEAEVEQMAKEDFAELQATATLFPDELVESELGEVPKGWDKYSLSKMITLIGGGTPKRSEPNYWNGDIFWFSVKDVPNEGEVFVITTQEKISELGLNKSSTKLLPVGTTIITARGTVGKIALVGYEMAMNQSCYGVQGINGVRQFMTYYLIKNAVEVLKKNTHGAVFDTITQSTFDTVTSIKPSIEMMDLFESKVEKIMGHIKNNLYENNSLIALRDTLLPKLLSGELDVSGVQDEVA